MKEVLKDRVEKYIGKYKYNTILTVIIFILFLICGYSNRNVKYELYLDDVQLNINRELIAKENKIYIHTEDVTNYFKDNITYDKLSGNYIITTYDSLKKIKKDNEEYVVKCEQEIYLNLIKIMEDIDKTVVISKDKIYITDSEYIAGTIVKNRTELYDKLNNKVIGILDDKSQVKIQIDEKLKNKDEKFISVLVNSDNYGYILKENVEYKYEDIQIEEQYNKRIIVKTELKLSQNTNVQKVDGICFNMYRLSAVNDLAKLDYNISNVTKSKIYVTINNGQRSSNFDSGITSSMLNSHTNRYEIIKKITKIAQEYAGVNIDFGNLKLTDKENYTQFIKELAALLHAENKKIMVNIPSTNYIDVKGVSKVVDYIIIQPYMQRSLASKTSGPISSISYVKNTIETIVGNCVEANKIILEIPTYSILWTERRSTVINAEYYSMNSAKLYLKANNLKTTLDNVSGQNYINYTKGITTYKMWLEDESSMIKKVQLVNEYGLGGVSVYKSGMETKNVYDIIQKNIEK